MSTKYLTDEMLLKLIDATKAYIFRNYTCNVTKDDDRAGGQYAAHRLYRDLEQLPPEFEVRNIEDPVNPLTVKENEELFFPLPRPHSTLDGLLEKAPTHIYEWYKATKLASLYIEHNKTMPIELNKFAVKVLNGYYEKREEDDKGKLKKYDIYSGKKHSKTILRNTTIVGAILNLTTNEEYGFRQDIGLGHIFISEYHENEESHSKEKTACGIVQAALQKLDIHLAYGTITDIWKEAKTTDNKN